MIIGILGTGLMGRAIVFDLARFSNFQKIILADNNKEVIQSAKIFLKNLNVDYTIINVDDEKQVTDFFQTLDVAVSAVPYRFNLALTKIAIETKTHFLDLGGNNTIVNSQRNLSKNAAQQSVTIIPDCGLAPGMASVIARDAIEYLDSVDFLKIRVGGLPVDPKPPLNYQIVFSPYGLINEYVEDAIILDNGKIKVKKSMTEIEDISFSKPFEKMEAFLTSGGCSTLPYTYKDKVGYLDYKTIRYPGHCEKFKTLLDLGFSDEQEISVGDCCISPREVFVSVLLRSLPYNGKDVVLVKILCGGKKNGKEVSVTYTIIDYYDEDNDITSMMRTTAFPISITAQMIERNMIKERGVFCSEEIVPPKPFFEELKKRNIIINKRIEYE